MLDSKFIKAAWERHAKAHPELKSLDPTLPDKRLTPRGRPAPAARPTVPPPRQTDAVDSTVTPNAKLRIVPVTTPNNEELKLVFCLLGVRKNGDGLELVVLGKDKEALTKLPLKKVSVPHEMPIELEAKHGDNDTALVTITLLGKYQAVLSVKHQEP